MGNKEETKPMLDDKAFSDAVWHLIATEPGHGVSAMERAEYERELEDLN